MRELSQRPFAESLALCFLPTMMFSTPRNACQYSFERSAALMEYGPCKACREPLGLLAGNLPGFQGTFGLLRVTGNMDHFRLPGYDFLFIYECMPMLF